MVVFADVYMFVASPWSYYPWSYTVWEAQSYNVEILLSTKVFLIYGIFRTELIFLECLKYPMKQ